jgi:hypothetical protein
MQGWLSIIVGNSNLFESCHWSLLNFHLAFSNDILVFWPFLLLFIFNFIKTSHDKQYNVHYESYTQYKKPYCVWNTQHINNKMMFRYFKVNQIINITHKIVFDQNYANKIGEKISVSYTGRYIDYLYI